LTEISQQKTQKHWLRGKNATALLCAGIFVSMVGMSYAAVPLYNIFCRVTGYAGTTQIAYAAPTEILDRAMQIRFDANVARQMPWDFEPVVPTMMVRVGETAIAYYRATNNSDRAVRGTASFNVSPDKAGSYFSKIECFCFTEQVLAPGESVDMPVTFFVDPDLVEDKNLDDVATITLSYTFFEVAEG
jgi:cytochrome c oxidase assembly protein subunit 11